MDHSRRCRRGLRGLLPLAVLLLLGATAASAEPAHRVRGWLDPLRYRDLTVQGVSGLKHTEAGEMLDAIVNGSQMGPGEGWFHPGESRYGWKWLAQRYDTNHDGTITLREFTGPTELFLSLDRDHDGVLTPDDFDWSDESPYLRRQAMINQWFRMMNRNGNGRISHDEWEAFFKKMAKDRDSFTPDDLRDALTPPMPPPGAGSGDPSPLVFISGLLQGELGSVFPGPSLGQEAPDFTLKREDGQGTITLSALAGGKPVVLVFGSFT